MLYTPRSDINHESLGGKRGAAAPQNNTKLERSNCKARAAEDDSSCQQD